MAGSVAAVARVAGAVGEGSMANLGARGLTLLSILCLICIDRALVYKLAVRRILNRIQEIHGDIHGEEIEISAYSLNI